MSSISCSECTEIVRKECYLSHIKKNHPTFFWNDVLCFHTEKSNGLRTTLPMKDLIKILNDDPIPYFMGGSIHDDKDNTELYLDASTGTIYNKETTAIKHIIDKKERHKERIFEIMKESLTPSILSSMFEFIVSKPLEKVIDTSLIRTKDNEIAKLTKDLQDLKQQHSTLRTNYMELKSDDYIKRVEKENDTLKTKNITLDVEITDLYSKLNNLERELNSYKLTERNKESVLSGKLGEEMEEIRLIDVMRKRFETDLQKSKNECEKIQEASEKNIKKLNKKIKSQDSEIKALKFQLKAITKQNKDSDSDSSDSD